MIDNNGIVMCQNPCLDVRNFLFPNGSCIATCPAPLIAAFDHGVKFCRNPCESTSDYLYANRSCLGGCPTPLQRRIEPIANFCVNPCHDKSSYLYQNGSCLTKCQFPLKTREEFGVKYCLSPCKSVGEFILQDGSCSSECPVPLIQRAELGVGTYCLNPCDSDDKFLYKNVSCLLNCPGSLETKIEHGGIRFCLNPCETDQYYFEKNKSCLDTCPDLFKRTSEEGINLCKNLCPKIDDFIYDDGSCHESCPVPLIIKEGNYCKTPCLKESEYVKTNGTCQENCEDPEIVVKKGSYKLCIADEKRYQNNEVRETIKLSNSLSEIGGILSCLFSGDPTSILMIPLLNMFEQIILIEVKLSANIKVILVGEQQIFSHIRDNLDHHIRILGVICLIYILLIGIKTFLSESRRSQISKFLHSIWNIFALTIIGMNGNALLYLFWTDEFKDFRLIEVFEFPPRVLICFLVILFTIFVIYKIVQLKKNMMSQEQSHERWRFLFETYKYDGVLIYIIRMTFMSLTIGCLSRYPRIQASLMGFMSFTMLLYFILGSPIKKKINLIQHIVIETGLSLYHGVFAIFVVFDGLRNTSGQLMTILYFSTSLITVIMIFMKLLYKAYHFLFKSSGSIQTGNIQLREFSENDEENADEREQQENVDEIRFREINQESKNIFVAKLKF